MGVAGKATCVAATGDWCGEGALWHAEERALLWTDNRRNLIHRYSPEDQSVRTWRFDETVAALALTEDPRIVCVVLGSRLLLWSPSTDERRAYGSGLEGWPQVRFNEAGVDPCGALWIGSMGNNFLPDGSRRAVTGTDGCLFRLGADGVLTPVVREIGVANTIAWSPDGRHLYSADTLANDLRVYPFDRHGAGLGKPRSFLKDFPKGRPDGSAVDSEGSVWNCRYGGGCVVRVSPLGQVQEIVEFPTINVTSCAFGGPQLNILYVTTAVADIAGQTGLEAGVFAIPTTVRGRVLYHHHINTSSG
jgi:sugar lactone lactonase YvrE